MNYRNKYKRTNTGCKLEFNVKTNIIIYFLEKLTLFVTLLVSCYIINIIYILLFF